MNKIPLPNQNANLNELLSTEIAAFWQHGFFSSFSGIAKINIHYAIFMQKIKKTSAATLVIVPGRCETYLKYQELAYDFYRKGYNLFIIDHRGQGLSERLLANVNKGHVVKFQDYVDDLQYFIEHIVTEHTVNKPYLLAHSMGGAIATRYMQRSPHAIKAAVIASPMLGFNSGRVPTVIAETLAQVKLSLNKLISPTPWYFLGQKDYYPKPFSDNNLTHSTARYQRFIDLYRDNKKIQLGGITTHWLVESIAAQKKIFSDIALLETPILLLQASEDNIVSQKAQLRFCQKLYAVQPQSCPNGQAINIDGAYHELFFEVDNFRNKAIQETLSWFKEH